jgi:hypothetical protein
MDATEPNRKNEPKQSLANRGPGTALKPSNSRMPIKYIEILSKINLLVGSYRLGLIRPNKVTQKNN